VAKHPQVTTQFMAEKAGLSIRVVQTILDDLEEEGYITRQRVGRGNRYGINPEKHLRHRLERHCIVGDMLSALKANIKER
jgi:DNA-binding transcriptional ArsR family regulator